MHASGGRSGDRAYSTPPCLRNCPASGPVGTISQMQRAGVHGKACAECHASSACQKTEPLPAPWRNTWQASLGQARGRVWLIHSHPALCVPGSLSRSNATTHSLGTVQLRERPRELPILLQDGRLQVRRPCQRPGASAQTSEIRRAVRQEENPIETAFRSALPALN